MKESNQNKESAVRVWKELKTKDSLTWKSMKWGENEQFLIFKVLTYTQKCRLLCDHKAKVGMIS